MPHIVVNGPVMKDLDKKREVVKAITDVIEKAYNMSREHIVVVIREDEASNVGSGGVLLCDR